MNSKKEKIENRDPATENLPKSAGEKVSDCSRSMFLANISHELRTPINAIIGMAELALNTTLSPEQHDFISTIKGSADSLLTLLNDLLDFSKMEAGKLSLDPIEFNIHHTIADIIATLAPDAHNKGLDVSIRIDPDTPERVICDPGRFRQIVTNLVGNAIKFTSEGEIIFEACESFSDANRAMLHFKILDTGIGIEEDKLDSIFSPFEQAENSTTRKFGGTGLGLAITKQLVQMMGGEIHVESELGKGSTFSFTINVEIPDSIDEPYVTTSMERLADLPVLVVDSNTVQADVIRESLLSWEMSPVLTNRPDEALEELTRAAGCGNPYRIVLLNSTLATEAGFDLAGRIKNDPAISDVKIILLVSAGVRGDAARCRELNIEGYLTKPVEPSQLFNVIVAVLNSKRENRKTANLVTQHSIRETSRPLHVLLAEDNPVNQKVTSIMLKKRGHKVSIAPNGWEALGMLDTNSIDVVLMDIQMPGFDGIETTKAIREQEEETGEHVPIVAMTAHAMNEDRIRCKDAGMDAYLSKPVGAGELFRLIESMVPSRGMGTPEEKFISVKNRPEAAGLKALAGQFNDDGKILGEIIELFRQNTPDQLETIRKAVENRDDKTLMLAAHTLKGAAGNFHADSVVKAARKLEIMGRNNTLADSYMAFLELQEELEKLDLILDELLKEIVQ